MEGIDKFPLPPSLHSVTPGIRAVLDGLENGNLVRVPEFETPTIQHVAYSSHLLRYD
jgi:hypothetical protein